MLHKRVPYRNARITKAAKGEPCTLNTPWCNNNPETTVFCHLNESFAGKGAGQKADDLFGFFGCSTCHDVYDGRIDKGMKFDADESWCVLRAVCLTQRRLLDMGIIK